MFTFFFFRGDQTKDVNNCFIYSPIFNFKSFCEYLLSLGANINEKDNNWKTALDNAVKNNSNETAELLISHCANIKEKNRQGGTALHIAVINNSKETAEILISHGVNINERDVL
ncbi:ankyrin repeat protein, putative [Trichomonas vaginalis G3]|uniref:Ankyrin repeat protein, putative n=1 Tax=Trichomonas vaginalis (strain ATCC PRA-98 / G3) TaxID=412133 RepID=A2FWE9_TRIV3|nr:ankyrin repeat and SOCS box-containing protein 4 family [Trichomonas vaginalis G3]EAX90776.1 ankyrin repeat protein, putative [Trichomonas vaginalis G3]KAI5529753.1 ankyrin repeat and SOCS box-containing protein 4 family [Trichomonas vaginalis G3]|eukprot:XP_001303706.1 ankyrin repeat protein [Trichomonas vaginalis G3]